MTKSEKTGLRDLYPSLFHRKIGSKCLMIDLDCMCYHYDHNEIVYDMIIDWKHSSSKQITNKYSSFTVYNKLSNDLNIPFFIVLTYLDPQEYEVPMYYVIPANIIAKNIFSKIEKSINGIWLSEYNYSRFEHYIRKIKVNELEIKNLCRKHIEYQLPEIQL